MKFFSLLILALFVNAAQAQTSNVYQGDLIGLRKILQTTPSYKDQIKGESLVAYNLLFEKLLSDTGQNAFNYRYFYNLAQLFFPIRDNHLSFYQINNLPTEDNFPRFTGNVDSLKAKLTARPLDSFEGIYHYDTAYTVALYKKNETEYVGVVVESKRSNWIKGQIAIYLYQYLPNYFKAIYAHPKFKNFILFPVERYADHSLINSFFYSSFSEKKYTKTPEVKDYTNLPKNLEDFQFKNLQDGIQYLRIKQFSADAAEMKKSNQFYDSIKSLLIAPNLILDLRNNEGGANKVSKKFLDLMERYTKNGRVFILINNGTLSQGEIFTLQIKQFKNVITLGQTTKGMLAYGSNYDKREKLPSLSFEIYITDLKTDDRLLPFENYGINPDVILLGTSDWINQTIAIIKKK